MNKKYFAFLLFPILFLSCSVDHKETAKLNIITIDTARSKAIGVELTTITTKLDNTIRIQETESTIDGSDLSKAIVYFDSLGREIKKINRNNLGENEYYKTYTWYEADTSKVIIKIDSVFSRKRNRLLAVHTIYGGSYKLNKRSVEVFKTYTLIGEVFRTAITPPNSNYTYIETIEGYYSYRNDIPKKYVEYQQASKTEFGLAYKSFIEAEKSFKPKIIEPTFK